MKYTFSLRRNVFMYNHVLTITDGHSHWEAINAKMTQWFAQQNETFLFYAGKGR